MPKLKFNFKKLVTYLKSNQIWNVIFSFAIALNFVNFHSLDVIFSGLILFGIYLAAREKSGTGFQNNFFFHSNMFNYLMLGYLISGMIGYATASPMGPQQWEEIFALRWVLGFYAFYFAGKKLSEHNGRVSLISLLPLIPSLFLLANHLYHTSGILVSSTYRLQGFYENPNHFALAIVLPWAFVLGQIAFVDNARLKKSKHQNITINAFSLILFALLSVMLLATYSRSAWFGALLAGLISLFYVRNRNFRVGAAIAFSAVIFILIFNQFGLRDRLIYSFDISSSSAQNLRFHAWRAAWQIFLDHPLFGVGFAENARMFPAYYAKLGFDPAFVVGNSHNQYLEVLSGTGIVGFVSYIGIFVVGFRYFHKIFGSTDDPVIKRTALSALLVIVALLGSSFTDTPTRLHECRNFLMILLGFALGFIHNANKKPGNSFGKL